MQKTLQRMSEPTQDSSLFEESAEDGDNVRSVTLSETAEATEHVLESCRRELQLLRRHLRGKEGRPGSREDKEEESTDKVDTPTPREQALYLASRLESCASALRDASKQ